MLRNSLLIFVFSFAKFSSHAQVVNIENRRIYDDTLGWSGAFDTGFSLIDNKDLLLNASIRPRVQYKTNRHYYLFLTDWYYSKGADRVYANSGMAHFRYAFRLNKKTAVKKSPWKWESYSQVQYNQLLDQRLRALAGTGIRVKALDNKGYRLFAGTSALYEYEDIQSTGMINEDVRWSNYLSWFFNPKPGFSFTGVTYFQPLFEDFKDYRFMGQYTLSFNLMKRLDFRFEFNTFYDAKPATNVTNWVFSSSFGLRVKIGE